MLPTSHTLIPADIAQRIMDLISKTLCFTANRMIAIIALKRTLLGTVRLAPHQKIL